MQRLEPDCLGSSGWTQRTLGSASLLSYQISTGFGHRYWMFDNFESRPNDYPCCLSQTFSYLTSYWLHFSGAHHHHCPTRKQSHRTWMASSLFSISWSLGELRVSQLSSLRDQGSLVHPSWLASSGQYYPYLVHQCYHSVNYPFILSPSLIL